GIDLDDCRDVETGEIKPWAEEIIRDLDSYAEVSPSRTGVKVIVRGAVPAGGNRKGDVEMYDRGRYFAVTGHRLEEAPAKVRPRAQQLADLHARVFPRSEAAPQAPASQGHTERGAALSDGGIIRKAGEAGNGDKFRRLWAGDCEGYGSRSEADL